MDYSIKYVSIDTLQKMFSCSSNAKNGYMSELNFMSDIIIVKDDKLYFDIFSANHKLINSILYKDLSVYRKVLIRCYIIEKKEIENVIFYEEFKGRYIYKGRILQ